MSDGKPGRKKQGNVIAIRDLPGDPIAKYLKLVARDQNMRGGMSAAGRLVLDTARMTGEFLTPASMRELQRDSKE